MLFSFITKTLLLYVQTFCTVCDSDKIMLASVGYGYWSHAPRILARHEFSEKHLRCLLIYRARTAKLANKALEKPKESEKILVQSF